MTDITLPQGLVDEIEHDVAEFRKAKIEEVLPFYTNQTMLVWKANDPHPPRRKGLGGTEEIKPLDLESTRKHYFGPKAWAYDHDDRETSHKWLAENEAVKAALAAAVEVRDRPAVKTWVLDIPCGTGRFFELFRSNHLDFIGMDVSDDMLSQARQKDMDADIRYGDIINIPLPDKAVDVSICIRLLNLILEEEMVAAAAELGRVTKSHIICSLFTGDDKIRNNRAWVHRQAVFLRAMAGAGFRIKKRYDLPRPYYHVWHCEAV